MLATITFSFSTEKVWPKSGEAGFSTVYCGAVLSANPLILSIGPRMLSSAVI
ncbi:hypothetical protein D3C80_2155230 [compost metagenome]